MDYTKTETINGYTLYESVVYYDDGTCFILVEAPSGMILNGGEPFHTYTEAVDAIPA